ncbi:MAG: hypothetical protein Q9195_002491 [Heterodermia aff. obscurata]
MNGAYNENASMTAFDTKELFQILFGDFSHFNGTYVKDTVAFDNVSISDFEFGLAQNAENVSRGVDTASIMGLGIGNTILVELQKHGHIKTQAFSLYLNYHVLFIRLGTESSQYQDARNGTLLFGGVDKSKYHGPLVATPLAPYPSQQEVSAYIIECTSLVASSSSGEISLMPPNMTRAVTALIDSGTQQMLLPDHIYQNLVSYLSPKVDLTHLGNLSTSNISFVFDFGGPKIRVPVTDFITPPTADPDIETEVSVSEIGFGRTGDDTMLLGDSFLRNAYAVFDADSRAIALAQSNRVASGPSDIVEIEAGAFAKAGVVELDS